MDICYDKSYTFDEGRTSRVSIFHLAFYPSKNANECSNDVGQELESTF